jgi:RNA polymerase sigma-54 factor
MILKTSQKQIQKTILAPSMQQSIEVLLLSVMDLNLAIDQELQKNPLLEVDEQKASPQEQSLDDAVNKSLEHAKDTSSYPGSNGGLSNDEDLESLPIRYEVPLEEQLLQQLYLELSDPWDIKIGEFIIGNLNEDGFLTCTLEDIQEHFQGAKIGKIQKVLLTIQNFEPLGIAARDIKECLSIQAQSRFNGKSDALLLIINGHLESLCKKKYDHIARQLKVDVERVKALGRLIASLEPKPARNYRPLSANIYVRPDVSIIKDDDQKLSVQINQESVPPLRINKMYRNLLNTEKCTQEEKEYIRDKVKNAILFIRSIEQRHNTLKEIAKYILQYQKDFFDKGPLHLRPMVLRDVALSIDRSESTVSRAINNKYVDTPWGIFALKYFFSHSMSDQDGWSVSNRSIKEELKALVEGETKSRPLSDREIHLYFERKNMKVARRTITKYRKALNILPAYLRKQ